jgi:probable HAF family extracellular repeat protein
MTTTQVFESVVRCFWLPILAAAVTCAAAAHAQLRYSITDLGIPIGPYDRTFARSVSDLSQIAGYSDLSTGAQTLGWRYTSSSGFVPLGLPPGVASGYSIPYGINDDGLVVGDVVFGLPDGSSASRSFRWSEATGMVLLPMSPGGTGSHAYAINDVGQTAGSSSGSGITFQHVARWTAANTVEDLGLPAGRVVGFGRGINNSGQLVVSAADSFGDARGYLYSDGVGFQDLGTLGGRVEAWGINDAGQIIGSSHLPGGPPNVVHAFVWSEATGMQDIGALPGVGFAEAYSINNLGSIVGDSLVAEGAFHAFLYRDGIMHDLNNLIDSSHGWTLRNAWDVSDTGFIVGWGLHNGAERSFLLTPVPEPTVLVLVICPISGCVVWRYRHAVGLKRITPGSEKFK